MTADEYVSGVRAFADWIEANSDHVQLRDALGTMNIPVFSPEELAHVSRLLGGTREKVTDGSHFIVRRHFGPIQVDVYASHADVCVRKVVGVKHVPEQVIPERVVEAHDEEIVEWECPVVLEAVGS